MLERIKLFTFMSLSSGNDTTYAEQVVAIIMSIVLIGFNLGNNEFRDKKLQEIEKEVA